jgi:DNA topoisomerase-1
MDPYSVTLEEIAPMIAEKRVAKDERTIKVFEKEKIQLLKGPYGPYIKQGLRNYKLNKEQQERVADLTIDEVKQVMEDIKANPPKKKGARKKA